MTNNLIHARVVCDPQRDLLVGTVLETGATYETRDPREMADLLFAAGVRHGYVAVPDWREGDIAPSASEKIALNHRLNQLGRDVELGKAMQALCQSARTSYYGNLAPAAFLAFLRNGVVADDCRTQLEYAIEELPPGLWDKVLRQFEEAERSAMKRTISAYATAHRLFVSAEMAGWLAL